MPIIRFCRSLFRSVYKNLPELRGSGKAPCKSSPYSRDLRQDSNSAAKHVVLLSRAHQNAWRGLISRAGYLRNSQAALLRRLATARLLRRCGTRAPVFAFMGFAYACNNEKLPKDFKEREQLDELHRWIQDALWNTRKNDREEEQPSQAGLKLCDYEIGERLGSNSCNSAVYAASHRGKNFAIKMLFNFGAASQSTSLFREFAKECQVLPADREWRTNEQGPSYTSLPPHPNILPLLHAFADNIPCLPDSVASYPAALPSVYGDSSFGRNRTLFLVMPRYSRTVQDYLTCLQRDNNVQVSTLLFLQLLEGIAHLTKNAVAHRDLKTDNLLLDEGSQCLCPRLVIADFGCCLADRRWGLRLPFISEEIDRGGNARLMAPEIATAVPSEDAVLDYSKSDAWAAGAIAYELFGETNPFSREGLDSATYSDDQIPPLTRAPEGVRKVVSLILQRDPTERVSADTAATMLHLLLWAPSHWFRDDHVTANNVIRWLIGLSLRTHCRRNRQSVEDEILWHFICRISVDEIMEALDQFRGPTN